MRQFARVLARPRLVVCFLILAAAPALYSGTSGDKVAVTHGPVLGRIGAREIGIWARTAQPGKLRILYSTQAGSLDQVSVPFETRLERDNTGWIRLTGLAPDTKYYYTLCAEKDRQPLGPVASFRTLPDAASYRNEKHNPRGLFNFRFEVGSCANQSEHSLGPALPAYATMLRQLKDKVHFAIMNGDHIYEERREYSPQQWLAELKRPMADLPALVQKAPTVTGVWANYKLYLERGKAMADWHRHVPAFFTFDDHEILNDVNGCGQAGLRDRRAVFRDIALQAWMDYVGWANPLPPTPGIHFGRAELKAESDVLLDASADFRKLELAQMANLHVHWGTPDAGVNDVHLDKAGGDPNAGVYDVIEVLDQHRLKIRPPAKKNGQASYSIGRRCYYRWRVANCDFFALDTRSHRTKHDVKRPDRPDVTMLGAAQKAWLLDGMAKSDADFFFVVSSVPFMIPHDGAGGMAFAAEDKDDAWTVFLHEREELIRAWQKLGKPVFVLTGDLHNSFAIKIAENVWEFCCGPHNSTNHNLGSEGKRPPNGPFTSRNRSCDIRWSTFFLDDTPRDRRKQPVYCVVQVNNVFNNPVRDNEPRWIPYPHPQVVFQYHDGRTGDLLYAESTRAERRP